MQPIRSLYEDDPDMLELVQEFASELPRRAQALEGLLSSGEMDELQRMAHQLKGAGGGYGFPPITDAAADLESAIKAGASEEIKDRLVTLLETLRAVEVPEA